MGSWALLERWLKVIRQIFCMIQRATSNSLVVDDVEEEVLLVELLVPLVLDVVLVV
jgi:hypothetical protein